MEAKQFSIAKSSNGTLGLITSKSMVEHAYPEGATVMVWTGVIIQDNTFQGRGEHSDRTIEAKSGGFWSSSNPIVVGQIDPSEIVNLLPDRTLQALDMESDEPNKETSQIVPSVFVSRWDEGLIFTPCDVDLSTGKVINIVPVDDCENLEHLISQSVELEHKSGSVITFNVEEQDNGEFFVDIDDVHQQMKMLRA